jgi:hypothetical protein
MVKRIVGQTLIFRASFKDPAGALTDPANGPFFAYLAPGETVSTVLEYNVDPEVVRTAAGRFRCTLPVTAAGTWTWAFHSYELGADDSAVADGTFEARARLA